MSIVVETFLICDGCGETFGVDNRHQLGQAHRADAKQVGWQVKGKKDYCHECVAKRKIKTQTNQHEQSHRQGNSRELH